MKCIAGRVLTSRTRLPAYAIGFTQRKRGALRILAQRDAIAAGKRERPTMIVPPRRHTVASARSS